MSPFEALRMETLKAQGAVPSFVGPVHARRIAGEFARAIAAMGRVRLAPSPARMAKRCPATVGTLERLAKALGCAGGPGWEAHRAPVLAAVAAVIEACNELVRVEREARKRIAAVLGGAA